MLPRKFLNSIIFMAALGTHQASAAESEWAQGAYLKARIITEKTATGKDATISAALDIVMQPDWHIYWRMPGDGGLAPVLDWKNSKNLKDAKMLWPAPLRFDYAGLYGFGYKDTALIPLTLTPEEIGNPVKLSIHANIMVCKDICVPQVFDLSLDIPSGDAKPDAQASVIADAIKALPYTENRADMKIENVVLGPKAIVVRAYLSRGFDNSDIFVEISPDFYIVAKPEITLDEKDPRYASMVIAASEGVENLANEVMGKKLILTLTKDGKALERSFDF